MSPIYRLLTAAGALLLLAGCQVRDDDPVAVRQHQLDEQTQQLQAKEQQLEARADRLDQLFKNQSLPGMSQRIDDLQDQLKQLRGDVEVLEHDQDLDKKQQRDLYQDLDKRLQKLELGLPGSAPAVVPDANTAPNVATTPAPMPTTVAVTVTGGADEADYQRSFDLLKRGRFSESIKGFKAFLKKYANSALAPNAEFWTGEAYFQMNDFETALTSFKKVLKDYPKSGKASDAMLKVGYCQYELQQWKSARQSLNAVVQGYPDSNAAKLASQRLLRMQDEGH
jgi:tol-pal system protein YbgF